MRLISPLEVLRTAQLLLAIALAPAGLAAQVIRIDITPSHSVNSFVPREALGAGVDRIPVAAIDHDFTQTTLERVFEAGWQPVTYRQNTDLAVEAWHWNPQGTWSDRNSRGYFVGSTTSTEFIRYSYGYALPHRGFTRNDGTGKVGFSRLTDGDESTYWKSNPYLTRRLTGEDDSLHPQWVILDLANPELVDTIKIAWAEPYASQYVIQYWTGDDPIHNQIHGVWTTFPRGMISNGNGGTVSLKLSATPISARFVRIWMNQSSNTCDTHGSADPRNCAGYAIKELYLGVTSADGVFHDLVRHTPDQEQSATYCSSVDPWHEATSAVNHNEAQVGFDLFFTSGVTRGLPAVMPVAMLYDNPDNAAAEIQYLEKHKYPIAYVEMGEEADGQYMLPEDYGALYLQYATALRRIDPHLKLGGPSFQGVNEDIQVWPDAKGRTSWLGRFLDYLKQHGRMQDLQFFSFEHYPYEPCRIDWGSLYDEPTLVSHIISVWRNDGIPPEMPMFITESNLSSSTSETYMDIFGGLWLADYAGSFFTAGGKALYYFHYLPLQMERGCNDSAGTFGMFTVDADYKIKQPLSQFFAARIINHEWLQMGGGTHRVFPASSNISDDAGHVLVTAYAVERPDGQWSIMLVNRDQFASHRVHIAFEDRQSGHTSYFSREVQQAVFGSEEYQWHPAHREFNAHLPLEKNTPEQIYIGGDASPDGPIRHREITGGEATEYTIPPASIAVIRGQIATR